MGFDETKAGEHPDAFWKFFHDSEFFKHEFENEQQSDVFYRHFRCGILHQAQTKRESLVRYGEPKMVQLAAVGEVEKGLIIDRELFHSALVDEINSYAQRVRCPQSEADRDLREPFVSKMNLVAT